MPRPALAALLAAGALLLGACTIELPAPPGAAERGPVATPGEGGPADASPAPTAPDGDDRAPGGDDRAPDEHDRATATREPHDALALAAVLATIDEAAEVPDYRRAAFGDGWADLDGDGCDTRQEVLARDLEGETLRADGCTVLTGTLDDPYTGTTIVFLHSSEGGDSQAVQIDHVVSLSAAHAGGAWAWTDEQRLAFANDERALLAVDGPTNASKSDRGPADWMPEDVGAWCDYAARYTAVVAAYDLAVLEADRAMLVDVLTACG